MNKQHHIEILPGDVHRAEFIASLFDEAEFVVYKRQYVTYTGT